VNSLPPPASSDADECGSGGDGDTTFQDFSTLPRAAAASSLASVAAPCDRSKTSEQLTTMTSKAVDISSLNSVSTMDDGDVTAATCSNPRHYRRQRRTGGGGGGSRVADACDDLNTSQEEQLQVSEAASSEAATSETAQANPKAVAASKDDDLKKKSDTSDDVDSTCFSSSSITVIEDAGTRGAHSSPSSASSSSLSDNSGNPLANADDLGDDDDSMANYSSSFKSVTPKKPSSDANAKVANGGNDDKEESGQANVERVS
jgi:hypothetical protein